MKISPPETILRTICVNECVQISTLIGLLYPSPLILVIHPHKAKNTRLCCVTICVAQHGNNESRLATVRFSHGFACFCHCTATGIAFTFGNKNAFVLVAEKRVPLKRTIRLDNRLFCHTSRKHFFRPHVRFDFCN